MLLDEDPATVSFPKYGSSATLTSPAHPPHDWQLQHYTRQARSFTHK
jgi:hypothetical protein